ncbi:MAG: hypothetical protein JRF33_27410 [Deltaproteobacteria bacterium]|nr:hypothetical protein [Deltaproteobacteria bacterium]
MSISRHALHLDQRCANDFAIDGYWPRTICDLGACELWIVTVGEAPALLDADYLDDEQLDNFAWSPEGENLVWVSSRAGCGCSKPIRRVILA